MDFCLYALVISWNNLTDALADAIRVYRRVQQPSRLAGRMRKILARVRSDLVLIREHTPPTSPEATEFYGRFDDFYANLQELLEEDFSISGGLGLCGELTSMRNDCPLPKTVVLSEVLELVRFRAVASVDLARYSTSVGRLNSGTQSDLRTLLIGGLNRDLEAMMTGLGTGHTILSVQGDGALIALRDADLAHAYATELHSRARAFNDASPRFPRHFRIGISYGRIFCATLPGQPAGSNAIHTGGYTIVVAVRLQAEAESDGTLLHEDAYELLSETSKAAYHDSAREVRGKRREKFRAHRSRPTRS